VKVSTSRLELLEALESVRHVVVETTSKPILECVRIDLSAERGLEFSATDLETCIRAVVPLKECDRITPGSALVPLRGLLDFLKACEGASVTLEAQSIKSNARLEDLHVSTSAGEALELRCEDPEEFPILLEFPTESSAGVPPVELASMLRRVEHAVATSPGRCATHCARLEMNGKLEITTTDGRRLAVAESTSAITRIGLPIVSALLPRRALELLPHLLPSKLPKGGTLPLALVAIGRAHLSEPLGGEARAQAAMKGSRPFDPATEELPDALIGVASGRVAVVCRAVNGEFPRFRQIAPKDPPTRGTLPVKETLRRLKVARSACDISALAVRLEFGEFGLSISGGADGRVKASARVNGARLERGGKERIGIDPEYLADALKASGVEEVTIGWTDAQAPLRIDAPGFLAVMMPITIGA
jgi:DNA polymerase III sliding clamp (beta) subunit (PCNA family)